MSSSVHVSQNSSLQGSVDSSLEIFVWSETGSMEASPVAAQEVIIAAAVLKEA